MCVCVCVCVYERKREREREREQAGVQGTQKSWDIQNRKKILFLSYQTGDPEDPDDESKVVSMSSEGRTPAVSDSARRSDTTPSIAENTYPSLFPMISTGSPTRSDSAVPSSTAVRL